MSDVSTRQVGPVAAKSALLRAFKARRPVFLWGAPGIGKSDVISQIGQDLDAKVIDIRLSLWDPTDIKGVPYFDSTNGKMAWAPPIELPDEHMAAQHKLIILFLDEMNSAAPAVQAAAYQLVLNRRVGTYELPDNVLIVAAGNRESDKGVTYRMPAPLANRFIHLEMKVDFDDWAAWATGGQYGQRQHPDVVGYLTFAKNKLFNFDSRTAGRSFETPRSWSFVSELLFDNDCSESTLTDLVAGTIGEGTAIAFMAHRKIASKLPNPSDILKGKVKKLETKEISAMYSLTVSLCYELKDASDKKASDWNEQVNHFFRFIMDNFETEIVVMGTKLALTQYQLPLDPDEIDCFDEFHDRFGKYIAAATDRS